MCMSKDKVEQKNEVDVDNKMKYVNIGIINFNFMNNQKKHHFNTILNKVKNILSKNNNS